jgi:hypothetical protein
LKLALIDNPNAIYLAHALYDEFLRPPTYARYVSATRKGKRIYRDENLTCDICGEKMKGNAGQLPRSTLNGFESVNEQSPVLCYTHAMGWNVSFSKRFFDHETNKYIFNNEDLILHFAIFLTKQLIKLSKLKELQNG